MAVEVQLLDLPMKASPNVPAAGIPQFGAVVVDTAASVLDMILASNPALPVFGINQDMGDQLLVNATTPPNVLAGSSMAVRVMGISKAIAGAAIAQGQYVVPNASGQLVPVTALNPGSALLANPSVAPTVATAGAGGAVAAGTYAVAYSWITASGETLISPTASITTAGTTSTITVTVPQPPAGAIGWNLYISAAGAPATLFKQSAPPVFGALSTVQTAAVSTTTAQAPAANTASGAVQYVAGQAYTPATAAGDFFSVLLLPGLATI